MDTMLRVEHLTKQFGPMRAVDNLTFSLGRGRICGFVGPNGAGKTTTMRIIATLEEPTAGTVFVNESSIHEEPYKVRRLMGFMPDHYGTYPAMTCRDYLEFYARAYEVEKKVRKKRIDEIMDFTGLDKIGDKEVETLSKGMRQRLNLGRALVNDPDVLIMDEPAAGLDPRARVELRYLVRNLADMGKAVLISSHILTELSEICDTMLIIDHGRCVRFGTFDEIQQSIQQGAEVEMRLFDNDQVEALEQFLMERPNVEDIRPGESGRMGFAYLGEAEDISVLMRDMLNADFKVMEFRPKTMSMEDVFIHITQGEF